MSTSTYDQLATILTKQFGVPADDLTPDATFEALGLDSLDLVEITLAIQEELGVRITDEALNDIVTPADAVAAIDAQRTVNA